MLLNPHEYDPAHFDAETRRLLRATIDWFEQRGKAKLTEDYHARTFYADFLEFAGKEGLFSTFLTPAANAGGNPDKRWDTSRVAALSEILGFYGLNYWYPWQVTILGLGPVWQSGNSAARERAAAALDAGGVGAFGLSEKDHGADIYSSDLVLTRDGDGYRATGFGGIGMATHSLYEAITHAHNRVLYRAAVTNFPHVRREFVEAYARLTAMKLFSDRAVDYFRSANPEDRRYLLFNPITKMKVTTEAQKVIGLVADVVAAKGFEADTYLAMSKNDIDGLPKLEGTVAVNLALIAKFMPAYLFAPQEYAPVGTRTDAADDEFLFRQGPARGLSKVRFHDWKTAYAEAADIPNVALFTEQAGYLVKLLTEAAPDEAQQADLDFGLALTELFTLIVYGQLILEQARITRLDTEVVDQIFAVLVQDFSAAAVDLNGKASSTEAQQAIALAALRKPVVDAERFENVWTRVRELSGVYAMHP
jgi:alkylation response protein AidB-like acyl-CoA dehydrogenase